MRSDTPDDAGDSESDRWLLRRILKHVAKSIIPPQSLPCPFTPGAGEAGDQKDKLPANCGIS